MRGWLTFFVFEKGTNSRKQYKEKDKLHSGAPVMPERLVDEQAVQGLGQTTERKLRDGCDAAQIVGIDSVHKHAEHDHELSKPCTGHFINTGISPPIMR